MQKGQTKFHFSPNNNNTNMKNIIIRVWHERYSQIYYLLSFFFLICEWYVHFTYHITFYYIFLKNKIALHWHLALCIHYSMEIFMWKKQTGYLDSQLFFSLSTWKYFFFSSDLNGCRNPCTKNWNIILILFAQHKRKTNHKWYGCSK